MANQKNENDAWVDARLAALLAMGDDTPDPVRALGVLRSRIQLRKAARPVLWWVWALPLSVVSLLVILVPSSRACAQRPGACAERLWRNGFALKVQSSAKQVVDTAPLTPQKNALAGTPTLNHGENPGSRAEKVAIQPEHLANLPNPDATSSTRQDDNQAQLSKPAIPSYKQIGSSTATTTFDIYIDYQCPPCATFFRNVIPLLTERYVDTGKLRLIFRDWPLPKHKHARLAAHYANAAGQLGYYTAVMGKIFETQKLWAADGDIDRQVATIVPAGQMELLRDLVRRNDLPDSVSADEAAAHLDGLHRTPSVIATRAGKREIVDGEPTFDRLTAYLDASLPH